MLKRCDFVAYNGDIMPLLNNSYFVLTNIDGFTTVTNNLSSITIPYVDGDTITNVQTQPRTVIIDLQLKQGKVAKAKDYILRHVKSKLNCKIQIDGNKEIEGVVESINLPRFEQGCIMQITIHCSYPYWTDIDYVVNKISDAIDLHYFPMEEGGLTFPSVGIPFGEIKQQAVQTIINAGDASAGVIIHIVALGTVKNPSLHNVDTGDYIGITDTLTDNDEIIINTMIGNKSITKNGANAIEKITAGSKFLQLAVGKNQLRIDAEQGSDKVYFAVDYKQIYI